MFILALALGACGTSGLRDVRSVSVLRESYPVKAEAMTFRTRGQDAAVIGSAIVGGVVGGVIAASVARGSTSDYREGLAKQMQAAGVDPGLIVAAELERALQTRQYYTVVPGGADAEFHAKIEQVGFVGASDRFYPTLTVTAKLVRGTKVLWSGEGETKGRDEKRLTIPGYSLDVYLRDPQVVRGSINTAARAVVRDLLDQFREEFRATKEEEQQANDAAEERTWKTLPRDDRRRRELERDIRQEQRGRDEQQAERDQRELIREERAQVKADRQRAEGNPPARR